MLYMIVVFVLMVVIMVAFAIRMLILSSRLKKDDYNEISSERFFRDIALSNQGESVDNAVKVLKKHCDSPEFHIEINREKQDK